MHPEISLVPAPECPDAAPDVRRLHGALPPGTLLVVGPSGQPCPSDVLRFAREAMATDPRIATVSNCDTALVELSGRRGRIRLAAPATADPAEAFASAPAGSHVVLNPALFDLVGRPDLAAAQGDALLAEVLRWAAAANHRGLRHRWRWSGGTSEEPALVSPAALDVREAADAATPVGVLVDRHRAAFDALTVGVDASWLGANETGAQVATVHWLAALAARTDIAELRLHKLPNGRLPGYAAHLAGLPCIRLSSAADEPPTDIYWRPYQPDHLTNAARDRGLGRRLVTTVLDLIDHSNERYHADIDRWVDRRSSLRSYLNRIDMVTAISRDVVDHLLGEVPGLEVHRVRETALGVDHLLAARPSAPPPDLVEAWSEVAGSRFLLVLGNDFMHKNRDFAIRVWQSVCESIPVDLVLAGLHVRDSSTKVAEDVLLSGQRGSRSVAVRLAHVSQPAKTWLLANAAVVLYPSSAEGFGFIPHEAATLGSASLATSFGPLQEFLPDEVLSDGWSVAGYRDRTLRLLADDAARQAQIERVLAGAESLTWAASAAGLAAIFRAALALPPRSTERSGAVRVAGVDVGQEARALEELTSSLSWRVTRPLRATAEGARRAKRRLRG